MSKYEAVEELRKDLIQLTRDWKHNKDQKSSDYGTYEDGIRVGYQQALAEIRGWLEVSCTLYDSAKVVETADVARPAPVVQTETAPTATASGSPYPLVRTVEETLSRMAGIRYFGGSVNEMLHHFENMFWERGHRPLSAPKSTDVVKREESLPTSGLKFASDD